MSMNHHGAFPEGRSEGPNREQSELLKKFAQQIDGKKSREYPAGRSGPDDDGELVYVVGSDPETGIVRVDFGKAVTWLGLEPQHAIELAQSLIKHARAIAKEPLVINLH